MSCLVSEGVARVVKQCLVLTPVILSMIDNRRGTLKFLSMRGALIWVSDFVPIPVAGADGARMVHAAAA